MSPAPDDWRRMGQEDALQGARLTWKRYQALSAQCEHEHCAFCWHEFLDAQYSDTHRETLAQEPDRHAAGGYTNLAADGRPAGKWWICARCFADFADELAWTVVQTDPEGWPYEGPEPRPRATSADFIPPTREWLSRPQ